MQRKSEGEYQERVSRERESIEGTDFNVLYI